MSCGGIRFLLLLCLCVSGARRGGADWVSKAVNGHFLERN
jgi:hypothetical protein